MSRLKTSLLIIVALLTVTILFVVLALPSLVRSKAAEAVPQAGVRENPFFGGARDRFSETTRNNK